MLNSFFISISCSTFRVHSYILTPSNDFLLSQLYREKKISEAGVKNLRKDSRTVIYTRKRADESVVLEKRSLDNDEFIELIQDNTFDILF